MQKGTVRRIRTVPSFCDHELRISELAGEQRLDGGRGCGLLGALFAAAGALTAGMIVEQYLHGKVFVMVGAGFCKERIMQLLVFLPLAASYDGLTRDIPYEKYLRFFKSLLRRFDVKAKSVLDLACSRPAPSRKRAFAAPTTPASCARCG